MAQVVEKHKHVRTCDGTLRRDNFLDIGPIWVKVVPIEMAVWERSIGTIFVSNGSLYRKLWAGRVKVVKPKFTTWTKPGNLNLIIV